MGRKKPNRYSRQIDTAILCCLEKTLNDHGISKYFYNLHGYSEDKICLESNGTDKWALFYGSRGQRTNEKIYTNIIDASRSIISQLAGDENEAEQMICQFNRKIKSSQGSRTPIISTVNADPAVSAVHAVNRTAFAAVPVITEVPANVASVVKCPVVTGVQVGIETPATVISSKAVPSRQPVGTKSHR